MRTYRFLNELALEMAYLRLNAVSINTLRLTFTFSWYAITNVHHPFIQSVLPNQVHQRFVYRYRRTLSGCIQLIISLDFTFTSLSCCHQPFWNVDSLIPWLHSGTLDLTSEAWLFQRSSCFRESSRLTRWNALSCT